MKYVQMGIMPNGIWGIFMRLSYMMWNEKRMVTEGGEDIAVIN